MVRKSVYAIVAQQRLNTLDPTAGKSSIGCFPKEFIT
jgi:hypothetical protein